MNDFNQTPELPGFEQYPDLKTSILPDFNQLISKRVDVIKQGNSPTPSFDPYNMMLKKKQINSGEVDDKTPLQTWPEQDIKALEDFCKQHGLVAFNSGKMAPVAALAFLKARLGLVAGPVENSVSLDYKNDKFNPSYPYSSMVKKKTILKG